MAAQLSLVSGRRADAWRGVAPLWMGALRGAHRGREKPRLPPPSEPDVRVSRIRLSSWWFTVVRTDSWRHGPWSGYRAPVPQRPRSASADDNQAVPDASFHALFERRQHAIGPHRRFGPCPAGAAPLLRA